MFIQEIENHSNILENDVFKDNDEWEIMYDV